MEIPNLSASPEITQPIVASPKPRPTNTLMISIVVIIVALISGFGLSRLSSKTNSNITSGGTNQNTALSTDNISNADQLIVGKLYGDVDKAFTDTATGTIEKGSLNGEGTHILNRDGGPSQRAALTSSSVDLDLFVGKKVEVKGQTNASTKTTWFMDVGTIKILQ